MFYTATEDDDPDPHCVHNLTVRGGKEGADEAIAQYSGYCKRRVAWSKRNNITKLFNTGYARVQWLQKKRNSAGWICAQRRMAVAVAKLGEMYQQGVADGTVTLPDMLILADDDTYVTIDLLKKAIATNDDEMKEESDADPSAKVYAGCLVVHAPAQVTQWTFPFGGWGTYFTKGALERLILPLHCDDNNNSSSSSSSNNTTSDYLLPSTASFRHGACSRLVAGDDLLSEAKFYKPGMTIADILGAQASVKEKPYCLHSDWSIGYYVNFYNISGIRWRGPESHISWYPDAPQTRLHPLSKDSFIYRNKGGNCELRGDKCTANSMACHYMNETQMQHVYNLQSRVVNHNDGVNSRVLQHKKSPMLLSDTVS